MKFFRETTHLSEILEESEKQPVVIFIYSSSCNTSSSLAEELNDRIQSKVLEFLVYRVTVQTQPALSEKIETWFKIKHESPQIIILDKGKVTYTEHHKAIDPDKFVFHK